MKITIIKRHLIQVVLFAILSGVLLLCGVLSDKLTNTTSVSGQISASLVFKSPFVGMVVDSQVNKVEIVVKSLNNSGFDTTVRFPYKDKTAEILHVPVGTVKMTVNGLDIKNDTIYAKDTTVEVVRNVTTRPVMTLTYIPPFTLTFTSPENHKTVDTRFITVYFMVSAKQGIGSVTVNGEKVTRGYDGWSWSNSKALPGGLNRIPFKVWDTIDNVLIDTFFVTCLVDVIGPVIKVNQPTQDSVVVGDSSIIVSGKATDTSGILNVTVNDITASSGNELWSAIVPLDTGANRIIISASDNNSNITRDTLTVFYSRTLIDSVLPTIAIDNPRDGDTVTVPSATVSCAANDLSGIQSVSINGITATLFGTSWNASVSLSLSRNTIIAVATDKSARQNKAADTIFVVYDPTADDNTPPKIAITSPSNNTIVSNGTGVSIAGTASDASDIASVTVNGVAASYIAGTWSATINLTAFGINTVKAIAVDGKQNHDSAAINVIYDTSAADLTSPAITLNNLLDKQVVPDSNVLIQVTATDANGIDSVTINGIDMALNAGKYEKSVKLTPGANMFTVAATDNSANHNGNTLIFTLNFIAPDTPVVTAAALSSSSIQVDWQAVSGALSYNIYRCATATGTYTAVATGVTGVSYTNAGLSASTTWYYKVSATNNAGTSAQSVYASAKTNDPATTVPAIPTGVNAVASSASKITVSWNPVTGADSCVIYRSDSATGTFTRVGKATGSVYADSGLTMNGTYYYKVSAVNTAGPSGLSTNASATTMVPPVAPGISGVVASDASLTITWSLVSGATSYNLYYKVGTTVDITTGIKLTGVTSPRVVTGLTNGTQYTFAVSAVSGGGESGLSAVVKAMPMATVTDIDGNVYHTVTIGTQVWMVENLKTTKYNDGTTIPLVTDSATWAGLTTPGYCFYANNAANKTTYGALYNWYVVNTGKLVPAGWHVPDTTDFNTLENYLIANGYNWDGTTTGNKIAKSLAAKTNWSTSTNIGAIGNDLTKNNSSGFSALPGGNRTNDGTFFSLGYYGICWSATAIDAVNSWTRDLNYYSSNLYGFSNRKNCGFSVRLVKGDPVAPVTPPAPTISSAVSGDGSVTVTWGTVTGATSYNLYYSTGTTVTTSGTKITSVTSPKTVTGLTNGTQYAFAVSAVNATGESGLSGVAKATPTGGSLGYATWQYSKRITINTSSTGASIAGTVINFPVLVRLTTANFTFSQAMSGGVDIRFSTSDGTTHLPYQIERWIDNTAAEIWVKVDQIMGNNASQYILMYYGKPGAVDSSIGSAVFDTANSFVAAYHLRESSGAAADATVNALNGMRFGNAAMSAGAIGYGQAFDGSSDYFKTPVFDKGNFGAAFTLSAWVYLSSSVSSPGALWSKGSDDVTWSANEIQFYLGDNTTGSSQQGRYPGLCGFGRNWIISNTSINPDGWHYLVYQYNPTGSLRAIYLDGVSQTLVGNTFGGNDNAGNFFFIGRDISGEANNDFNGQMDEMVMSKTTRSADWIKLCYQNQKPGSSMVTIAP